MKSLTYAVSGLALLGAAAFLSPSTGSAAGLAQMPAAAAQNTGAVPVQWGRCARWYRICRIRWGYGWRFRRCMAIHACLP